MYLKFNLFFLLFVFTSTARSQSCPGEISTFLEQLNNEFVVIGNNPSTTFNIVSPFDFRIIRFACGSQSLECPVLTLTAEFSNGTTSVMSNPGDEISFTIPGEVTLTAEAVMSGVTNLNLNGGVCNNIEFPVKSVDRIEENACDCTNYLVSEDLAVGEIRSCGVQNTSQPFISAYRLDPTPTNQIPFQLIFSTANGSEFESTMAMPSATIVNNHAIFIKGLSVGQYNITSEGSLGALCDLNDNIVRVVSEVLPVEYSHFSGRVISKSNVLLEWSTIFENNNRLFEIERSNDGLIWVKIGETTPNISQKYSFIDEEVRGQNYYRIVQVDYDGTQSISEIISIRNLSELELSIGPNPVGTNGIIKLMSSNSSNLIGLSFKIIDTGTGNVRKTGVIDRSLMILIDELEPKSYILHIEDSNKSINRLIVKK